MEQIDEAMRPRALAVRGGNIKSVLLGLVCAVFLVSGLWMIVDGPAGIRILGLITVAVFGLSFLRFLSLFRAKPALVIDDAGILDNGSLTAAGFIPWSVIEGIVVPKFTAEAFIRILVNDAEEIFSRLPSWKVRLMRINRGLTGTAVNVPVGLLPVRREELVAFLREKRPGILILPDDVDRVD